MFEIFENFAEQNEQAYGEREDSQNQNQQMPGDGAKEIFVISAGGSIFFDEKPIVSKIAKFCELINRLHSEGKTFVIVCGGGKTARNYVAALKSFGENNFVQDELGIKITRANAAVFISALENSHQTVLTYPTQALSVLEKGKIPVFGGLFPFFTTDAVGALIAEALGGTFVNLTDVDGVYNADPKKNPAAKFFETMTYDKLISLIKLAGSKPGQNMVLDLACCLILKRSRIKGIVLNGNDLENFEAMIREDNFKGTVIADDPQTSGIEHDIEGME